MTDTLCRLRTAAGYYDASYPPDILGGGGGGPVNAPTITGMQPVRQDADTSIDWAQIQGNWLQGIISFTIGGSPVTVYTVVDYIEATGLTIIDFTTPVLPEGLYEVRIITPGGVASSLPAQYEYQAPAATTAETRTTPRRRRAQADNPEPNNPEPAA